MGVAHNFFRYQPFLTLRFWQIVEAKSKTMGCWVRSRPLLRCKVIYTAAYTYMVHRQLLVSLAKSACHGYSGCFDNDLMNVECLRGRGASHDLACGV